MTLKDAQAASIKLKIAALFCLFLILPLPVGLYGFTRVIVFICAIYAGVSLIRADPSSSQIALVGITVVSFNPIFPFFESRSTWILLDIFASFTFYSVSRTIEGSIAKNSSSNMQETTQYGPIGGKEKPLQKYVIEDLCLDRGEYRAQAPLENPLSADVDIKPLTNAYRDTLLCPYCGKATSLECEHNVLDSWVDYSSDEIKKTISNLEIKLAWDQLGYRLSQEEMRIVLARIERYVTIVVSVRPFEVFEELEVRVLFCKSALESKSAIDLIFSELATDFPEFRR